MLFLINLVIYVMVTMIVAGPIGDEDTIFYNSNEALLKPTRRILRGRPVGDTKPYMVYLRAAPTTEAKFSESDWLCGGVIIHDRYILTSAACIEDAQQFYVVSGTSTWVPQSTKDNDCIKNGAKKAVWKCVPKSYVFDGDEFDNIRWMVGDIAVVKVEDNFNFEKRVRGCDFIPQKVDYNNFSIELEKPRTSGSVAGWGSVDTFGDPTQNISEQTTMNKTMLREADVQTITRKNCKRRWDPRYHYIIDEHMICTKDVADDEVMSSLCAEHEVNCKELQYSDDEYSYEDETQKPGTVAEDTRRMIPDPSQMKVHTARHFHDKTRRKNAASTGGFCENDHGGPLIVGQGKTSVVVGVMSACLAKDIDKKCYGPFLYTSVFRYRNLINCAINKDIGLRCATLLRMSKTPMDETYFDWSNHPDAQRSFRSGKINVETKENEPEIKQSSKSKAKINATSPKLIKSTTKHLSGR